MPEFNLMEKIAQSEGDAQNLLYIAGKTFGEAFFAAASQEILTSTGAASIAKVPFAEFLRLLNEVLAKNNLGVVSLGKEGKSIVITHSGEINKPTAPGGYTVFMSGFWVGIFNIFGGGSLKGTPKNSHPSETVVYLLAKS